MLESSSAASLWDGARLYGEGDFRPGAPPRGAATAVTSDGSGRWRIVRDPLGINKLFWAFAPDGVVLVAARPRRLIYAGVPFEEIKAIPRGMVIDVAASVPESPGPPDRIAFASDSNGIAGAGLEAIGRAIRGQLDRYLQALASAYPSARVFVCLSGGLDSSGIAVLAREHFSDVVAVSFDLGGGLGVQPSDDRQAAERLARDLGMSLARGDRPHGRSLGAS